MKNETPILSHKHQKIVIIGGTGRIGSKLAGILHRQGHEIVIASPSRGINSITGEGLAEALSRADVVVDVTNSPSFEDQAVLGFFTSSTRNLLAAERAAKVSHHVALSIVGADRLPKSGYLRAKVAQEELIRNGGIPFTIVRATQFFEFIGGIADSATSGNTVRLPSALMQPVVSDDVAAALAPVVTGAPLNGTVDLAGPEAFPMAVLAARYLEATGDLRATVADDGASYFGTLLEHTSLVPAGKAILGSVRFEDWLRTLNSNAARREKGLAARG